MFLLAVGLAVLGWFMPAAIPLCFQPEGSGQAVVVCPTQESTEFDTTLTGAEGSTSTSRCVTRPPVWTP